MRPEQAKELFSDYYEGTLANGLKTRLEQLLEDDPDLNREYLQYSQVMESLNTLTEEPVPVPSDLYETISRRVDRERWETKRTQRTGSHSLLGKLVIGAAAVGVLAIGFFAIQPQQQFARMGLFNGFGQQSSPAQVNGSLKVVTDDSKYQLRFEAPYGFRLEETIDFGSEHRVLQQNLSGGNTVFELPVENKAPWPATLKLTIFETDREPAVEYWVVLPPVSASDDTLSAGTALDFARHVSVRHRSLVVVEGSPDESRTEWLVESRERVPQLNGYEVVRENPAVIRIKPQ
ncbi:MAG: hypothetical protein ACK4P3_03430 [Fimbriimonadaceae bacterium]